MKNLKITSLVALLLISNIFCQAQLSTGTNGFFVTNGTTISIDSLVLIPSADLSLSNTNFTRTTIPITSPSGGSISRVYNLSQPLSVTGTVGLFYLDAELNGNTAADLAFVYQQSSDNNYVTSTNSTVDLPSKYITQAMAGAGVLKISAVNSGIILPIFLSSYTAKAEGSRAKIEWSTTSEQNNDRFVVEHSADATAFVTIATVKGTNTSLQHSYFTYDNTPVNGTNYYRLLQYNKDGSKKSFGVKAVVFNMANMVSVVAFPNPIKNILSFKLQNYTGQKVSVSLFDMHGLLIHKEEIQTRAGQSIYPVNLKSMPSAGDYILKVTGVQGLSTNVKVSVL